MWIAARAWEVTSTSAVVFNTRPKGWNSSITFIHFGQSLLQRIPSQLGFDLRVVVRLLHEYLSRPALCKHEHERGDPDGE